MRRRFVLAASAALMGVAVPLPAQQQSATTQAAMPQEAPAAPHRQALTIQPISVIVGFYSGEYERAVSRTTTLGFGAGYFHGFVGSDNRTDPTYVSLDGKVRFYPGEQPLRGFSFGATAGYSRGTSRDCVYDVNWDCSTTTSQSAGGPSLGFQLDYNWLLGRSQSTVVALGLGAKRLFINDHSDNLTLAYPTARISVGMAF